MYKKLIAAVLTLAMVLCTWAPAFADTVPESETLPGAEESVSEVGSEELTKDDEKLSEDTSKSEKEETPKETAKEKAAHLKAEKYRNGLASYMRK
ncbi:MAG: hypothetical protein ACI4LJ_06645, partial [Anaerovoracaceae bacterium]